MDPRIHHLTHSVYPRGYFSRYSYIPVLPFCTWSSPPLHALPNGIYNGAFRSSVKTNTTDRIWLQPVLPGFWSSLSWGEPLALNGFRDSTVSVLLSCSHNGAGGRRKPSVLEVWRLFNSTALLSWHKKKERSTVQASRTSFDRSFEF